MRPAALLIVGLAAAAALIGPAAALTPLETVYDGSSAAWLAWTAFNGADFHHCLPKGQPEVAAQRGDVGFAWWNGGSHLFHGTGYGDWDSKDIRAQSFYTTAKWNAKLHTLAHSYFPTALKAHLFEKKGPTFDKAKVATYTPYSTSSASPDVLFFEALTMEKFALKTLLTSTDEDKLSDWRKVWKKEWDEQSAKQTGTGKSKKDVPKNVAASRTMLSKWGTQFPSIPLNTLVQQRSVPPRDVGLLLAAWNTRKTDGELPKGGDLKLSDSIKKTVSKIEKYKDLADMISPSEEDKRVTATLLYDEVILKGQPGAHDSDESVVDPGTNQGKDAVPDHLQAWVQACETGDASLPYSLDYRTYVPHAAGFPKPPVQELFSSKTLSLNTIRGHAQRMIDRIGTKVHSKQGKKMFKVLKRLATKSSAGPLTPTETSQIRAAAYGVLGDFCGDEAKWNDLNAVGVKDSEGEKYKDYKRERWCKRSYLSTHAAEVPLSRRRYAELVRNNAGKKMTRLRRCTWSYKNARCEPTSRCVYSFKFGDRHLAQSCVARRG